MVLPIGSAWCSSIVGGELGYGVGLVGAEVIQRLGDFGVAQREDRRCQQCGIYGAGAADTELAVMLSRLVKNGDPVPAKLKDYVEHQWQRPSLQAWLKNIK